MNAQKVSGGVIFAPPTSEEYDKMMASAASATEIVPNPLDRKFVIEPNTDDCGGVEFVRYNRQWCLSADGDMACGNYFIDKERLAENWIGHMMGKKWFDANTFIPAYVEACRRAGVRQVNIDY